MKHGSLSGSVKLSASSFKYSTKIFTRLLCKYHCYFIVRICICYYFEDALCDHLARKLGFINSDVYKRQDYACA